MPTFNIRLKSLRQERDISQQLLANEIGISKSSVNMYERGEREPGIETVTKIAEYFNVDVDYLFGTSDVRKREEQIKILDETQLTEDEMAILKVFRLLSEDQQKMLLEKGSAFAKGLKKD